MVEAPPSLIDSPTQVIVAPSPSPEDPSKSRSAPEPIQFPKSAFVGLGGDFVNLYGPRLESPPEFLFASWHACFGAAISPFVRLDSVLNLPPRIYVVNLGSSAVPRKSTSIKVAIKSWQPRPIAGISINAPFRVEMGLGSVEGFVRVFNGWSRKKVEEQAGDSRPTLIVYDELRSFVQKAKQDTSTLLPFLTQMFEGEDYDNTTVNRPASLRGCHLSLVGACTLETFADMWTSEFMSIGFTNRLFLVKGDPQRRISLPENPPESAVERFQSDVFRLVEQLKKRHSEGDGRIGLSPEAKHLWDDYYRSSAMLNSGGFYSKRLDTYAFKWMMLLALSQGDFEINRATVDRAIELIEYQHEIRKQYDPIDADNQYAQMEEKVRRYARAHAGSPVKRRELFQACNARRVGNHILRLRDRQSGEIR